MHRSPDLRAVVVLVLLSVIATPVLAAGPRDRPARPAVEAPGFVGTLWHALASLFAPGTRRAKSGSIMDPNGLTAAAGTCSGERGSIMDPNGCTGAGNQAGAQTDRGSVMNPD